jgi:hypothetical protein
VESILRICSKRAKIHSCFEGHSSKDRAFADTGIDSAREIREYYVPDFSNWKNHDSYSAALDRPVRDLKPNDGSRS